MLEIPECSIHSTEHGYFVLQPAQEGRVGLALFELAVRAFMRENTDYEIEREHLSSQSPNGERDLVIIKRII